MLVAVVETEMVLLDLVAVKVAEEQRQQLLLLEMVMIILAVVEQVNYQVILVVLEEVELLF